MLRTVESVATFVLVIPILAAKENAWTSIQTTTTVAGVAPFAAVASMKRSAVSAVGAAASAFYAGFPFLPCMKKVRVNMTKVFVIPGFFFQILAALVLI